MSSISTAPFPYENSLIDWREATKNRYHKHTYGKPLPPIESDPDDAWLLLEPLLAGIEVVVHDKGSDATYGTVARLEFIWDDSGDEELRGVAIFDIDGRLIVHVQHALLGYSGFRPLLSQKIMQQLGITEEMFNDIQRSVWDQRPYVVAVSRQKHDVIDGVDTTYATHHVESEWSWWRVR